MKAPCAGRVLLLLSLVLGGTAASANDGDHPTAELVKQVRQAVGQFQDVQLAVAAGYEPGPCVSGPNGGAMGIHYVNPDLLDDAAPVLTEPEALIYEPRPNGQLRLVGVEYITLAGPAVLEGHLLNFVGSPNRYGLPEFYELHVWAWRENPDGTFADWNPRVSCDAAPVS
jgi:hypothetical protein